MRMKHLVWFRRISQTSFLILFLYLLAVSRLPQTIYLQFSGALPSRQDLRLHEPVRFFFHLDPLTGLSSLLSGHHLVQGFIWGGLVLFITLFLGRVFCGFICPLGTIHHLISRLKPSLQGERMVKANRRTPGHRVKYFFLLAFLLAAALRLNMTGLLDPISLLFRSLALAIVPGMGVGLVSLFHTMASSDVTVLNLLSHSAEVFVSPVFGYKSQAFQTGWFIGILFLFILFLNRIKPRFWCRVLCPLGALLGVFSRVSLLKLEKDPGKCTHCNLCTKNCQGAASPMPDLEWESSECVVCFNCFHVCPEDALAFRTRWSVHLNKKPDMGRRAVLGGMLAGLTIPFLGRIDGRLDRVPDPSLIRPPGALSEKAFLTLCQRCALCMKACPTNVINPTLGEAGMAGFWTPRLIMTLGYCEYTCTLCGSVCPTGAIQEISMKEKTQRPIKIGSAYVDRGRCLPWSGNTPCIVCEEHCPTSPKAIYLKKSVTELRDGKQKTFQLPFVDLSRCIGCGICEYKCPVQSNPAIRVIAAGESRSSGNRILL